MSRLSYQLSTHSTTLPNSAVGSPVATMSAYFNRTVLPFCSVSGIDHRKVTAPECHGCNLLNPKFRVPSLVPAHAEIIAIGGQGFGTCRPLFSRSCSSVTTFLTPIVDMTYRTYADFRLSDFFVLFLLHALVYSCRSYQNTFIRSHPHTTLSMFTFYRMTSEISLQTPRVKTGVRSLSIENSWTSGFLLGLRRKVVGVRHAHKPGVPPSKVRALRRAQSR